MALYGYVEGRDDGLGVPDNVILRCSCVDRCEIEVEKQKGEVIEKRGNMEVRLPDEYYITFKSKAYYNTLNMIDALKIKLKKIWCIIRGKDYTYYDIEVQPKAMKKFVEGLEELLKN